MNNLIKTLQYFEGEEVIVRTQNGTDIKGTCKALDYTTKDIVLETRDTEQLMLIVRPQYIELTEEQDEDEDDDELDMEE